jgi:hypothetical protein
MIHGKRGDIEKTFVISLVLISIVALLLLGWLYRSGWILNDESAVQKCRLALELKASTRTSALGAGTIFNSPFKAKCTRRILEISENEVKNIRPGLKPDTTLPVYVKGKPITSYNTLSREMLYSELASSMRRCWYMGLEGKEPVFNARGVWGEHTACMICDEIHIDNEEQFLTGSLFEEYLQKTPMPGMNETTYEEYIFPAREIVGSNGDNEHILAGGRVCLADNGIDTNTVMGPGTYATVFFRGDFNRVHKGCMATYVVDAETVRSLCEYSVN